MAIREQAAIAPDQTDEAVAVTVENFTRAETDKYFSVVVQRAGGLGRWDHYRKPMAIDDQSVIRANRDTLYSAAVFDLDAGAVAVAMPDAGARFTSLMAISQDHYVMGVEYGEGSYTFTREHVGTRYLMLGVRMFVDPGDSDDLSAVHALQDAITIDQDPERAGRLELPQWDQASQKRVHDALIVLGATLPDTRRMFGTAAQVDPVRHLIGTATGWGGNPERDAMYLPVTPERNDGRTAHELRVGEVPVDGFWSITVYNSAGYMEPNDLDAYSLNSVTADREPDGAVKIRFGGCGDGARNCLPITVDWNYWVRLYRPRTEILDGSWHFPAAMPVQ